MATTEETIRKAAANLKKAIEDGQKEGLFVTFPSRLADLGNILISETGGAAKVTTTTVVSEDVPADVATEAGAAAQAAADKVVAKALDKEPETIKKV